MSEFVSGLVVAAPAEDSPGRVSVLVADETVWAAVSDQCREFLAPGVPVTLLSTTDGYLTVATRTSDPIYGPELILNGGFEYGLDGWVATVNGDSNSPAVDVVDYGGSPALHLAATNADGTAFDLNPVEPVYLDPSSRYRGTVSLTWVVRQAAGANALLALTFGREGNPDPFGQGEAVMLAANGSRTLTLEVTTNDSAAWGAPWLSVPAGAGADFDLYIDSVSLRRRIA